MVCDEHVTLTLGKSMGTVDGNTVTWNKRSGVQCNHDSAPLVQNNRIQKNEEGGIRMIGNSSGTYDGNIFDAAAQSQSQLQKTELEHK